MSEKIVLSDLEISQVEALAAYLTVEQIADYFGISRTTFYAILNRDPRVLEHYNRGTAKACSFVGSNLMELIRQKENSPSKVQAIIFYLRTRAGWSEKQELNVTTKDVTPKEPPTVINHFVDDPITKQQKISDRQSENEE